ncbi:type III-B CRISPR module RAMP protein Cmr4 [Scytonema hofmannii FACHB-248]|uniref:Type III-B CRISPR module RAMP protein Cmr4 n=1 Tax=Scytonema hofmannii FACHB-248 TaxID=1842502 RepID=A0ABR8GR51_9CYAN|nr:MULTISPECIES: RAMP superfamily CRISPR-associated protein [Nostocales]MBD2605929.1 type III-B CRISPR module RAMP protein Cmr4 [Scytonema hofmannii FACHB-248]
MYQKAYGIIETLAPLHVGASAGEETGNLNLIFRDQFTQTGIIPGSSIRGRFRADIRRNIIIDNPEIDGNGKSKEELEALKKEREIKIEKIKNETERKWYGHEATLGAENATTEANVKFEYASLVWLPVFCPGQPIIWVTCPRLLKRYKLVANINAKLPKPYTAPKALQSRQVGTNHRVLFFNLGFIEIEHEDNLSAWIPTGADLNADNLLVVADNDIAMLHDMGLYRQSRVKLASEEKKVEGGAFFNVEALPEGSILVFPIALKEKGWKPFGEETSQELYFGGLESIGFGHCRVRLGGDY